MRKTYHANGAHLVILSRQCIRAIPAWSPCVSVPMSRHDAALALRAARAAGLRIIKAAAP